MQIVRYTLGLTLAAATVAVPVVYYNYTSVKLRNLYVVEEGKLYRSGQLTTQGLKEVVRDYGIRTVVTLRAARRPGQPHPDAEEEAYCNKYGVRYVRLAPQAWSGEDGEAPAEENVRQFCAIMSDPKNQPVLVHCFAGVHRTGQMCAIYRMTFNGWSLERARAEMVAHGYDLWEEHADVRAYLTDYYDRLRSGQLAQRGTPPAGQQFILSGDGEREPGH